MANVLTNLAADIYKAADIVGRELTGITSSVTINAGSEMAALNDVVRSSFTRPAVVTSITPSMTIPEGTDQTVDNKTLSLNQTASVKIPWTGEDIKHVNNGAGFETIYGDQIKQAMRAIANQIESALWVEGYKNASRAYGTAGTTPFASNFNEIPQLRKILADNGMPFDGNVTLAVDTTAAANLRSLAQLTKVNEAGGSELVRQGTLLPLQGFYLKESAAIAPIAVGSGTGYLVNGALAVGTTAAVVGTGSGTILQGDIITVAGDANKYVIGGALSGTALTLGNPGLRKIAANSAAITVGGAYTPNLAFHKAALELAMRPFAAPPGGDLAVDQMVIQDPWSGLVFVIRAYKGYLKAMFDVQCVYGVKAWKGEFIATLAG